MQAFEATARHLSFSLAAEELCVSQSAVSHQIKSLESFLGKKLFTRSNNKVSLTGDGDIFFSVIKECFKNMQTITDHLVMQSKVKLKIIAQTSIAVEWLAPRLSHFNELHPDITIELSMTGEAELQKPSEYDILIGAWPSPSNFISKQIREESFYPVCSPEVYEQIDITNPSSILALPLISSENGQDWELWMQHFRLEPPVNLAIQHVSHALLAAKVAQGKKGITMSCDFVVNDLVESGHLVAMKSLSYHLPWGNFFVHYRSGNHYLEKVEAFVDWLISISNQNEQLQ